MEKKFYFFVLKSMINLNLKCDAIHLIKEWNIANIHYQKSNYFM